MEPTLEALLFVHMSVTLVVIFSIYSVDIFLTIECKFLRFFPHKVCLLTLM